MKKNHLQRVLALALASAMAMGTLTACGGKEEVKESTPATNTETKTETSTEAPADNTPAVAGMEGWEPFAERVHITVPVYDRGKEGYPAVDDNYWTQWIQTNFGDKWNIDVEYVAIPRGDVMTKYSMLIAAQDTPTILMEYDYPKVTQWANDGAMTTIDLDEFAQVAPTYYNKMVENDQLGYTDVNGETYFILSERPYYNTPYSYATFCRMDWLREVGYDHVPQNYEEYSDAIDKIIAAGICKEPAKLTLPSQAYIANFAFREFPANEEEWAMHSSLGTPCFAWEPTRDMIYKTNLEYHKGWYNKEFDLDVEATAGTDAETKFINGELFAFGGYMSANVTWLNAFYEKNPNAELAVCSDWQGVDGELQKTPALRADNPFGMIIGFSSLATEDELKAAWMLMEWMIQEENLFVLENGEEGVNFEYDENGIAVQINLEGTGNEKMMNHNCNIDMTCLVRAAKKVGTTIEDLIKVNTPQGLPQDFYQQLVDCWYSKQDIANQGMSYSDPIFAVAIEAESEYSATLLSLYQEYYAQLVKCDTDKFDELYAELSQKYLDAGYQEIMDARLEAYKAGQTTKLPAASKK